MKFTVRVNNVGDFALLPSRIEAMYAPETFGEVPGARVTVRGIEEPKQRWHCLSRYRQCKSRF